MDDERLAAELQRRASAASSRPDWPKRVLLPAVWREIDARPQRVVTTSRWSPRLGVAAVVVALLLTVVAIPRLVPVPPTSSSSPDVTSSPAPSQPAVLSTADFASRLAAGELNGKAVLVDGTIGARPAAVGVGCHVPIGEACVMGPLERTVPGVNVLARWVATDERDPDVGESDTIWPWAHLPTGPITGTFVLSVDSAGTVEFVGLVRDEGSGRVWSVADAAALDVNAVSSDDVILVDGWLTGYGEPIPCPFPAPGTYAEGLPLRLCPYSAWLADEPAQPSQFNESGVGLQVQNGAYYDYAPNPSAPGVQPVEPRLGTYAVARRLEGWCADGNPPCWLWNVVARVDPLIAPEVVPPATSVVECQGHGLPVSVSSATGLVIACTHLDSDDVAELGPNLPALANPDGDVSRLRIAWRTSGCATSASVSVMPNSNPPLFVISAPPSCVLASALVLGVELTLTSHVDANLAGVRFDETPTAPSIDVLSPTEFALALRASQLGGQVVLVDGAIEPGPAIPRPLCLPGVIDGHTCYLGELQGDGPPISVSTKWLAATEETATARFDEPRIDWPRWAFPQPPIRGVLVLLIRNGSSVEYLGRARINGSSAIWTVPDARSLDEHDLALDEVVLVDGWLTGIGGILDCLAPPDSINPGLPSRYCANSGWLMDNANRSLLSETDRNGGIELQDRAYHLFAPAPWPEWSDSGDGEPRRGIYALGRQLEGWCAAGDAPCRLWTLLGRVSVANPGSVAGPRTFTCANLSIGNEGHSGSAITVVDDTGLVESCHASWGDSSVTGVTVENPLPSAATLEISWSGRSCDTGAVTFRRAGAGFEVRAVITSGVCDTDTSVRHQLSMSLSQPVPAESVDVAIGGVSAVVPTPTPAPDPVAIPCDTTTSHATLLDQTGFIDACSTIEAEAQVDGIALFNDSEVYGLRVLWTASACDAAPIFRLYQSGMRYVLEGELYGDACGDVNVPYEIQLFTNADLAAESIDASLTRVDGPRPTQTIEPTSASQVFDTSVGRFEITVSAGKSVYRTNEPIDITGHITWLGAPGSTLEVFGGDSRDVPGLVHFGWEKLDGPQGDLLVSAIFRKSCTSTVLTAGQAVEGTFAKETGNFGDKDHDSFWHDYFAAPQLTLPPGRYRIQARARFQVGSCDGSQFVGLWVYSYIDVTE